jgi:serine/threonine protein kinase
MNQERWKQIDELFDAVLDLPETKRELFLNERCQTDEALKNEVLSLLNAQTSSDKFLENSALGIAARNLADEKTIYSESYLIGKLIGTYKIESLLGQGGMGEVYLATDEKLRRQVALKILPAEYTTNNERVKRFQLEARAISALNHPNIVTIYDVGSFEKINYIATEFVEGKTLREIIGGELKIKEVLAIIIQCCEALSAAHSRGIIHRDIKPENIIVRPDGYVKILDFGLAKLNEIDFKTMQNFSQTAKGVIIGTPAYMSPEQVADEKVDHRTDLWSIGVVLYEMLTDNNPFKKENRQTIFQAILSEEPPLVSSFNKEIPPDLDQVLIKALEKDADFSYQTASDLRADLKRIKREVDSSPSIRNSLSIPKPAISTRDNKTLIFRIALTVLIFFGIFAIWKYYPSQFQPSPWSNAITTQLTEFAGEENYPSISPDGKVFLFTRSNDSNWDIYWQRIGGSNAQNLTADSPFNDTQPSFSPNGEKIAFRSERSGGGIFVMGATGESVKRLTDFGFTPSWSPNGNEIIFSTVDFDEPTSRSRTSEIWGVDLSGNKRHIKTDIDATQPFYSPSGKRIVFWGKDEKYQRDLWTVSADGGTPIRLTNDEALDWNPVWSPDGKFIYFCSNRNGAPSLWRIPVQESSGKADGMPEAISPTPAQSWLLTLSNDGKHLIYVRRTRFENLHQTEFDPVKMTVKGNPVKITEGTKRTRTPAFSPDGNFIVSYITGEAAQEDIFLIKQGDSKRIFLTNDAARDRVPRFSPDGKRIVFYSNLNGTYEIYSISIDGTDRRQITDFGGKGVYYPFYSPNGKQLAYTVFEGTTQIINSDQDWSNQTPFQLPPLNDSDEKFIAWSWSPDGNKLAGWRSDKVEFELPGVYVYSFESNSYELISETAMRPVWLADSRHLIAEYDGKLVVIDTISKNSHEIILFKPQYVSSPFLTNDNTRLIYSVGTIESDIQMLSIK